VRQKRRVHERAEAAAAAPQLVDEKDPAKFRSGVNTIVAVDCLGAGIGEIVLFCQAAAPGSRPA